MTFALRPTYRRQVALQASYLPESRALFAAATVQPTPGRKGYIDKFIRALMASGCWTKIDVMWVLAAHDEQAGRLNWKSPGSFTLTAVNSPTFTTDRGFASNGSTSYLDTGWDWGTDGVQYTQNNAHIAAYIHTTGNSNPFFGTGGASYNVQVGSVSGGRITVNTGSSLNAGGSAVAPLQIVGRRNVSTDQTVLRDGVQIATGANASSTTASTQDIAFGKNGPTYGTARVSIGSLGAYLDDTEALAFYNACNAYMVALGADT
jgi:hypothetical protein